MKAFDVLVWSEVQPNVEVVSVGKLKALSSELSRWYVSQFGVEVLAHVGFDVDLVLSGGFEWRCVAPETARVFVFDPARETYEPSGEVFTNIDRRPMESEAVQAVTRQLRLFRAERDAFRRDMERERRRGSGDAVLRASEPRVSPEQVDLASEPVDDA